MCSLTPPPPPGSRPPATASVSGCLASRWHTSAGPRCACVCPTGFTLRRTLGSPCCGGWRARVHARVFLIRPSVSRRLGGFHVEAPVSHAAMTWVGSPGFRTVVSFPSDMRPGLPCWGPHPAVRSSRLRSRPRDRPLQPGRPDQMVECVCGPSP